MTNDLMMPTLPEPLEGLVRKYGAARRDEGEAVGLDRVYWSPPEGSRAAISANHAAFEAERALRLALNDLLQQVNG